MQSKKTEAPVNDTTLNSGTDSNLTPDTTNTYPEPTTPPTDTTTPPAEPTTGGSGTVTIPPVTGDIQVTTPPVTTPSVKSFTVTGGNFSFSPSQMKVKKGDTVKINFANSEGFHDWVLDEFNVRTPQIAAGKTASVEFVASKTGTFEYYCSVGSHRQMGMKGTLIVE